MIYRIPLLGIVFQINNKFTFFLIEILPYHTIAPDHQENSPLKDLQYYLQYCVRGMKG